MADKNNIYEVKIDSIAGGIQQYESPPKSDEYYDARGINPDLGITGGSMVRASGMLRPHAYETYSSMRISGVPLWLEANPKEYGTRYIYDSVGSVYTFDTNYAVTGLKDLNDAPSDEPVGATGNGMAYYDNYMYFARSTTVARYGPLNGVAAWDMDYWGTTLGKTALTNTTYPVQISYSNATLPNHILYRHGGRLYITDFMGGQGVIHFIQTTKGAVEGDTNDGSTYNAVDFPWGYYPTALSHYGDLLAVALYEGYPATTSTHLLYYQKPAKVALWDTTNTLTYEQMVDSGFSDPFITALRNVNGVLYAFSGQLGGTGARITRYIGGDTFEQVALADSAVPPLPGAVDNVMNKIYFGTAHKGHHQGGAVYALGSRTGGLSNVLHCVGVLASTSFTAGDSRAQVTALAVLDAPGLHRDWPILGWTNASSGAASLQEKVGLDAAPYWTGGDLSKGGTYASYWISNSIMVGRPFKIRSIRFNFYNYLTTTNSVTPTIYYDHFARTKTLETMGGSNYLNKYTATQRPSSSENYGLHSFMLQLQWAGTTPVTVLLPIYIEVELLDE
jgi:hypothetical protein